jgi:hypothetical protein
MGGFSKREPGILPYCPIALPRPRYPAPGTRDRIDTEHRRPSPATGKRAHRVCIPYLHPYLEFHGSEVGPMLVEEMERTFEALREKWSELRGYL